MIAVAPLADDAPHLLVVDDDRRIRDLLSRFLSTEGYRVTTADTAADARAKLKSLSFDLLVLDVMMPGENGFDFARALRTESGVPILMLTTESSDEMKSKGRAAGANGWLVKPFDPQRLMEVVKKVIG